MHKEPDPNTEACLKWMAEETTRMRAEFEVILKKFKEFQDKQTQQPNHEPA